MKIKSLIFTLILGLTVSSAAQARIQIVIDRLEDQRFPIAVPAFLTPEGKKAGGSSKKMLKIMHRDLRLSGLFQVLDDSVLPTRDRDVEKIDYSKWDALEVGALIKGIHIREGGQEKVQLRLYDVSEKRMILGKEYTVSKKTYVDAVHRFVDDAMEKLTGTKGPFHSKIVAACGKAPKRKLLTFEMDDERRSGVSKAGLNALSPQWSPDGSRVAYTAFTQDRSVEVYVGTKRVTNFRSTTITPSWTPDGNHLIVGSAKTGTTELYKVDLNGRVVGKLTRNSGIDFNAAVSGAGRVAFASERAGGLQLFVTSMNGGGAGQLTYTGYQNDQPDWSPDGSKIVFSGKDKGAFDIFIMDSDGSNIQRLTRGEGSNESPSWSPDGRYIAFHSTRGGIFIMNEDGTNQYMLEKTAGCVNLDWGPWLARK